MDDKNRIIRLLIDNLSGTASPEEREELERWLLESPDNHRLFDALRNDERLMRRRALYDSLNWEKKYNSFVCTHGVKSRKIGWRRLYRYAALLLLPLAAVLFWYVSGSRDENVCVPQPGKGVTLTLGDGTLIHLSRQDTLPVLPVNIQVESDSGRSCLVYQKKKQETEPACNTLTVPKGGEYKLMLSDGTFVHLNSDSRLTYPDVFSSEKREVFLEGEAWFEVAKDSACPFYVVTDHMNLRVYGTKFNINTHIEGQVQTALVEGKVSVCGKNSREEVFLSPNQVAEYDVRSGKVDVREVDVLPYIAWKDGWWVFSAEPLENILRQFAEWYGVEISYRNERCRHSRFSGSLKRTEKPEVVLEALRRTLDVHIERKGNMVVVY